MKRLPRRTRCRRILRATRGGLRLDLRYLTRLSGEKVTPAPKVLGYVLPVLSYLDSAQLRFCALMNRALVAKNERRYREAESRRAEAIRVIVELLGQPDRRSLCSWARSNHERLVNLLPEARREEAVWELQNLYLFPILKS